MSLVYPTHQVWQVNPSPPNIHLYWNYLPTPVCFLSRDFTLVDKSITFWFSWLPGTLPLAGKKIRVSLRSIRRTTGQANDLHNTVHITNRLPVSRSHALCSKCEGEIQKMLNPCQQKTESSEAKEHGKLQVDLTLKRQLHLSTPCQPSGNSTRGNEKPYDGKSVPSSKMRLLIVYQLVNTFISIYYLTRNPILHIHSSLLFIACCPLVSARVGESSDGQSPLTISRINITSILVKVHHRFINTPEALRLYARSDPADFRACDPLELPSPWRPVAPGGRGPWMPGTLDAPGLGAPGTLQNQGVISLAISYGY